MSDSVTITEAEIKYDYGNRTHRTPSDSMIEDNVMIRSSTPFEGCDWLEECIQEVEDLQQLSTNWDSYGGTTPDQRLLGSSVQLLISLCCGVPIPRPEIEPTPSGGVQFSWSNGPRYFEIEVVGEWAATYLYEDVDRKVVVEKELFGDEFVDSVVALIRRVDSA